MSDRQSQSKKLNEAQLAFPIGIPKPNRIPLDFSLRDVRQLTSESHAIMFSVRCAGYEPKVVPELFKIDPGQWSCIKDGTKHFPHNRRNEFMDLMGNEILLMYGAESRGYDFSTMRKHQTDVERENAELRQRMAQMEHDREVERAYMVQIMGRAK